MAAKWQLLISEMGGINDGGRIYHFAFSEGGLITEKALYLLEESERKRIIVNTFGSASLFDSKLALKVSHYVSVRDIVPMTDLWRYSKAVCNTIFSKPTNVKFIGNWRGIPLIDHGFENKSYLGEIKNTCLDIISNL